MNTPDSTTFDSPVPSLFQIAAFFEDVFPGDRKALTPACHPSVMEYMLNPGKLMALLKSGNGSDASVAAGPAKTAGTIKRPRPASPALAQAGAGVGKRNGPSRGKGSSPLKKVKFSVNLPLAKSVKLAGDFTRWEQNPVALVPVDGCWCAVVPLAPGTYSYRYIVDGQWFDDPACDCRVPNPFGTENAILRVA